MSHVKQKVLVTGASSFVGCHLIRGFSQKNAWEILPVGSKKSEDYESQHTRRIDFGGGKNNWTVLNLKNEPSIKKFIRIFRPDIWVHHAGYAKNYASPNYNIREGYDTNVAPLKYIFENLAQNGCKGVLVTGSSMEYSETDKLCLESDLCLPKSPYGQSKLKETLTALEMSKKFEEAIKFYKKTLEINPNHLETALNLINCYEDINELDKAIKISEDFCKLHPDKYELHYTMGRLNHKNGKNLDNAYNAYKKTLSINNNFKYAKLGLGQIYNGKCNVLRVQGARNLEETSQRIVNTSHGIGISQAREKEHIM